MARHFGYFCTESSGHLSDYLPWFRKNEAALKQYCDQPGLGGESGFSYTFGRMMEDKYGQTDYLQYESGKLAPRSVEYCSYILEALETGKLFRFNGNVMNDGYITNLPRDCLRGGARVRRPPGPAPGRRSGGCRGRWRP